MAATLAPITTAPAVEAELITVDEFGQESCQRMDIPVATTPNVDPIASRGAESSVSSPSSAASSSSYFRKEKAAANKVHHTTVLQ